VPLFPGSANRQDSNPRLRGIDADDRAVLKRIGVVANDLGHVLPDVLGHHVLSSHLQDARPSSVGRGEKRREIEIVGEHHAPLVSGPGHDRAVAGPRISNGGPVRRVNAPPSKKVHPSGREVHIEQYSHEALSGISASSARHAAYDKAAWMSSASR
jgi:hypothetical protein